MIEHLLIADKMNKSLYNFLYDFLHSSSAPLRRRGANLSVNIENTEKLCCNENVFSYRRKAHSKKQNSMGNIIDDKVYDVVSVEKGCYRIVDESGEDYLYFSELFEIVEK